MKYNFGDLAELSTAIRNAHNNVESLKGDIQSSSNQLRSAWSSDSASGSWDTVQTKWLGDCDELITALHQLSVTVQKNSDDMALTEAKNAGLFNNL